MHNFEGAINLRKKHFLDIYLPHFLVLGTDRGAGQFSLEKYFKSKLIMGTHGDCLPLTSFCGTKPPLQKTLSVRPPNLTSLKYVMMRQLQDLLLSKLRRLKYR